MGSPGWVAEASHETDVPQLRGTELRPRVLVLV